MDTQDQNASKGGKKTLIFIAILLIAAVFGFLANSQFFKDFSHKTLDRLNLIPKEEKFTELYFNNYKKLYPKDIQSGKKIYFDFSVHNFEGRDVKYKYKVSFIFDNGKEFVIDSNTVEIKNNETKMFKESYTVTSNKETGLIKVYLYDLNQEIFFRVPSKE